MFKCQELLKGWSKSAAECTWWATVTGSMRRMLFNILFKDCSTRRNQLTEQARLVIGVTKTMNHLKYSYSWRKMQLNMCNCVTLLKLSKLDIGLGVRTSYLLLRDTVFTPVLCFKLLPVCLTFNVSLKEEIVCAELCPVLRVFLVTVSMLNNSWVFYRGSVYPPCSLGKSILLCVPESRMWWRPACCLLLPPVLGL